MSLFRKSTTWNQDLRRGKRTVSDGVASHMLENKDLRQRAWFGGTDVTFSCQKCFGVKMEKQGAGKRGRLPYEERDVPGGTLRDTGCPNRDED